MKRSRGRVRRRVGSLRRKKGVVLLLIISMLALFSMITITYVVSASSHKRSSYSLDKGNGYFGTDPKEIADAALYLVMTGTRNPRSPFVFHDMLGDMYGHFGVGGTIASVQEKANGEFLEIMLTETSGLPFGRDEIADMGYLAGTVMTLLNGEGIGLSTHVIWQDLENPKMIRVRPWVADEPRRIMPAVGDRFWINGQPFSGYGFGYNRDTHRLDRPGDGGLVRDAPNFSETFGKKATDFRQWQTMIDEELLFGSANEEYDAADVENMFISYVPSRGTQKVVPSYHRPELIKRIGASKKTIFRPMKEEHPNFTGSNPQFDPINGPWDVDNDRDGMPDSIWMDPGWPAQVGPDGRTYKHLVAIHCRPLDGGINLNAVGNAAHAADPGGEAAPKGGYGLATGPAELDPRPLSQNDGWFRKLLGSSSAGGGGGQVDPNTISRYGKDGNPGGPQDIDRLRKTRQLNYPENWQWQPKHPIARDFATPPPLLRSTYPLDLDPKTGQPAWDKPSPVADGGLISPYELDLSRNASVGPLPNARDCPFTYAEYERILRRNDADATALPSRLYNLLPEDLRDRPELITTASFDHPGPNVQTTRTVRQLTLSQSNVSPQKARVAKHYVDILRARIKKYGGEGGQEIEMLQSYIPPEMRAGLRMDLNRPFGNGQDDNRNGIIDEGGTAAGTSGEGESGEPMPGFGDSNILNDDKIVLDKNSVRNIYIRNLYVLVLAVCIPGDETYDINGGTHRQFCQEVAQWCTNVCDMRDRDFIMTRFVYDTNPFDGWSPETQNTVFGVERPELIITEALAGHDNRIEEDEGTRVQRDKPQGWVYVELYNPWTDKEAFSGELYQHSRSTQLSTGVVLDQLSPPLTPGNAISAKPVWRLMFHRRESLGGKDDPFHDNQEGDNSRTFYFDDKPVTLPGDGTRNEWDYFRRSTQPIAPIRPGQFAVIGSRRVQDFGQGRKVELTPSTNSTGCVVKFFGNAAPADPFSNLPPVAIIVDGQRQPTGGDVVQVDRPANITEPGRLYNDYGARRPNLQGGYPELITEPSGTQHVYRGDGSGNGFYLPEFKRPLDMWRSDEPPGTLTTAGTFVRGYRLMHLQRLADPSKPFQATNNPFRTIDSMRIDMTVHNTKVDEDNLKFVSRERGVSAEKQKNHRSMLWMQETNLNAPTPDGQMVHSFGKRNKALGGEGAENAEPYPWLTWFNRPFANPMELLLVPKTNSYFLLHEDRGYTVPPRNNALANVYQLENGNFRHLRNFYYSRGEVTRAMGVMDWAMLFEFVGVPSPFVGTDVAGTPSNWSEIEGNRPPFFNKVSYYRDPGKVNLNAISAREPAGVVGSQQGNRVDETFRNLQISRGGGSSDNSFERPFRSYGSGDLIAPTGGRDVRPIDMTIFRAQSDTSNKPLFGDPYPDAKSNPWPNRNPYFYFQSLLRMANSTTTKSNVYGIWITVGRFEAEPVAPSEAHPDGFRLGAEIGWETGNVDRHRAFYIIDRSIPVAAQMGEVNNIHRAVMVSRLIE